MNKESKNKTWPQYVATFSVALGMISAGTTIGWTSPSMMVLLSEESPIPMSYSDFAWIISTSTIGTALSPIVAACLIDRIGRKPILIASGIFYVASWSLLIPANSVAWLYASKIFSGFAHGLTIFTSPLYISEISMANKRGAIGVVMTLSLGIGILFESVAGPKLSFRALNGISMTFPILFLLTFIWMPESPYFYASKVMRNKAINSLMWLRGQKEGKYLEKEMEIIDNFLRSHRKLNFHQTAVAIFSRKNRRGLVLIFVSFFAFSLSGVVTVASYTEKIFILINSPINPPDAVIMLNVFTSICLICIMLLIDKVGRKILLVISCIGSASSNTIIGTYMLLLQLGIVGNESSWIAILGLFSFKFFVTIGLTSIPMVLIGEIFPSETKTWSICIISIFNSVLGFTVIKLFQVLEQTVGSYVLFYMFACSLIIASIIFVFLMPETKNKSFSEIQEILQNK